MPKRRKKVLLIDDNRDVTDLLGAILNDAKYDTISATNAEDGLMILASEDIEVVFVDLVLPGMSGIEFCTKIREDDPVTILIAMTGHTQKFDAFDCRHFGFDDYFGKPFTARDITTAVKGYFRKLKRWNENS